MSVLYLAGRMRGVPEKNSPAFDKARAALEAAGHHVYCPSMISRACNHPKDVPGCDTGDRAVRHILMIDVACVMHCEAVYLIPGWEDSLGASMEVAVAQFLSLPLYCAETWQRIHPPATPWGLIREIMPGIHSQDKPPTQPVPEQPK